jgi:hypothetical protein
MDSEKNGTLGLRVIADLDARVLKRVMPFAAEHDPRWYLSGVHVVPGVKSSQASDAKPARCEATNGHILYCEEDLSAVVERELLIRISKRGWPLLVKGHRVRVLEDNSVVITAGPDTVYIEPREGVIDYKYPDLASIIGVPTDWHEGLRATVNSQYLLLALRLPGAVRFFSKLDEAGAFSDTSSVLFVLDGGTATGGAACGVIMPMHSSFGRQATVADMLPATLLATRMAQQVAA